MTFDDADTRKPNEYSSMLFLEPHAHLHFEQTIKKSRFIADAYAIPKLDDAKQALDIVRASTSDARHHCHGYVLYTNGQLTSHSSDDGEPTGTAGQPILNVITHMSLANVLVVVTRYFGGTLLGTAGLRRAYATSARRCLAGAQVFTHVDQPIYAASVTLAMAGKVEAALRQANISLDAHYSDYSAAFIMPATDEATLRRLVLAIDSSAQFARLGSTSVSIPAGTLPTDETR
ncbi:MAG: YigZ family protein [Actinomycetaceae bacterium]|nr:YigZ family protein [Actinomycetaceae bacterium]MDY6082926.1 YigZ family protein [Actinomycetaceae bacterium]